MILGIPVISGQPHGADFIAATQFHKSSPFCHLTFFLQYYPTCNKSFTLDLNSAVHPRVLGLRQMFTADPVAGAGSF